MAKNFLDRDFCYCLTFWVSLILYVLLLQCPVLRDCCWLWAGLAFMCMPYLCPFCPAVLSKVMQPNPSLWPGFLRPDTWSLISARLSSVCLFWNMATKQYCHIQSVIAQLSWDWKAFSWFRWLETGMASVKPWILFALLTYTSTWVQNVISFTRTPLFFSVSGDPNITSFPPFHVFSPC